MIQYILLEYALSSVISMIVEKYVSDPSTRRYVRQMAEQVVRELTREARRQGIGIKDMFQSASQVVRDAADRLSDVLQSVGISGEEVREDIEEELSSRLSLPEVAKQGIKALSARIFGGEEDDESLRFYEYSEKVLDRLIEEAGELVCLASPWVSDPDDLVEEGVQILRELPREGLELYLLVAAGENKPEVLRRWARLGFEVREAEGRKGTLGIHCKIYANERVALGASWNLTVSSLKRLRAMREVHTVNVRRDACNLCSANYEQLLTEFSTRWSEARQRCFRDEGAKGPAVFEVHWGDDRPERVVVYRENGERWFTIDLDERHEGFVFNGRAYRYDPEYRGFVPLVLEDDLATQVLLPFVGARLLRVRPKWLGVKRLEVSWDGGTRERVRKLTGTAHDSALVVWGLDPDPEARFYVAGGGRALAVRCRRRGRSLSVDRVDVIEPGRPPRWVPDRAEVDLGLLHDPDAGYATPALFFYEG